MSHKLVESYKHTYECMFDWETEDLITFSVAQCNSGQTVRLTRLRALTPNVPVAYNAQEQMQFDHNVNLIRAMRALFNVHTVPLLE
jgi:hypothetical protein